MKLTSIDTKKALDELEEKRKTIPSYQAPPKAGPLPTTSMPKDTFNIVPMQKNTSNSLNEIAWGDWSFNANEEKNKNINTDIAYTTVSKLPQYQNPNKNLSADKNLSGFYYSTNPYDKMTTNEKNTFLNLYNTDKDKATDYLNSISTSLNERNLGENSQAAKFYKDWSNKNKIAATGLNVLSGVVDLGSGFMEPISKLGTDKNIDTNAESYGLSKVRNWTNEGVTKDMGSVGKFLYNTGTSMAQTLLRLPLGAGSLPLAGLSAGSQAAYDATQRGATPSEALLSGTTSGIVEGIMEKIPLDSLRVLKNAPPDAARSLAKVILKQSGIEATEETLTEFTNAILDKAIMGDKSNFALTKNQYIQNGLNDTDAGTRAYFDTFFKQPAIAGLGGALSGGVMGAGGYKLNQLRNNRINNNINASNVESDVNTNQNVDTTPNTALQEVSDTVSTIPDMKENTVRENFMQGKSEISSNQEMTLDRYRKIKKYINQLKANGENIPEIKRLSKIIEDTDGYIEYYNMQSADNIQKYANKLVKELGDIYSFSSRKNTQSSKEVLNAIKRITANIRENENFSTDDIKLIEQTAFDQGFVKNIDEIKRNEGAKSWLRGLRLYVSPEVKGSISDYNDFRKSLTGKIGGLTTTDTNATSIDTAYQELHGMYPDLFPGDIVNEVEQLEKIKEVADSLVIRKTPLSEAWQKSPDGSYTRLKNAARSELMTALESYRKSVLNESNKAWNKAFERYNEDVKKGRFGKDYSTVDNIPNTALVDADETNNEISARNEVSKSIENTSEEEGSVLDFLFEDESTEKGLSDLRKTGLQLSGAEKSNSDHILSVHNNSKNINSINSENTPFGQNTVGSAQYNPNSLQSLGERYGVIEAGEEPISTERIVQIPKSIDGKTKVSKTARTAAENPYFDNDMENSLEQEILKGRFNYVPETNEYLMESAQTRYENIGFDRALREWKVKIENNEAIRDVDIAMGARLINEAAKTGNVEITMDLLSDMAIAEREAGKVVQAGRLLKRTSPVGRLSIIQKDVERVNQRLESKILQGKVKKIEINKNLAKKLIEAKTIEEANTISEEIYKDLANKIPYTVRHYLDQWRYFSMLSSIVTQGRNLFGNAMFMPARATKNSIGAIIEIGADKLNRSLGKDGIERSKVLNRFSNEYKVNKEFAKSLFDKEGEDFMSGGKYNIMSEISKYRKKSPIKILDKVMTKNSDILENTDRWFFKAAFTDSLAQYMTANGITPDMLNIPKNLYKPTRKSLLKKSPAKITHIRSNSSDKMSTEDYRNYFKTTRDQVKKFDWYGKMIENKDLDFAKEYGKLEGYINVRTLNKGNSYKNNYGINQIQIMPYLKEIFENGKVINVKDDVKNKDNISRIFTLLSPVQFSDGKIGVVKLNVKEYVDDTKSRVHENKILDILDMKFQENNNTNLLKNGQKKVSRTTKVVVTPQTENIDTESLATVRDNLSMAEMLSFVKGDDTKYLPFDTYFENINEGYNKALEYAVSEAKKATYRDESAFASMLTRLSKKNLIGYIGVEGLLPFKKTPINIFKRAVEYSPGGLMKGMGDIIIKVPQGKMKANEAIDEIAKGFTGSMVVMLGAYLASQGLIVGSGEEEDRLRSIDSSDGIKSYSLNVAGYSYPLSWAAPISMPLFVGVEAYNTLNKGLSTNSFKDIGEAMVRIVDPLFEASYVSSFTDAVTSMAYAPKDQRLSTLVSEVGANYLSQYIPNFAKPFVTLTDETKRGYYTDKNSPLPGTIQGIIQGAKAKIPGLSKNLEPSLDVWGREQTETSMPIKILNAFGPAIATKQTNDPVNAALKDLYSLTGETDVLPSKPQKYSTVNDIRKDYTAEEYTRATKLKGQTAYNSIKDIMESNIYNNMTPEQKRDIITDIYEYSNAITRDELDDRYEVDSWINKINNGVKETGMSAGELMLYRDMINGITKGDGNKSKVQLQDELINGLNISTNQKNWLSKNFVTRGTFIPDTETVVDHSTHENFVITQMSQSAQKLYDNFAWQYIDADEYAKIYDILKEGKTDEKKNKLYNLGYPPDFVESIVYYKNNPEKLTP